MSYSRHLFFEGCAFGGEVCLRRLSAGRAVEEVVVRVVGSLPRMFRRFTRRHRGSFLTMGRLGSGKVPIVKSCYACFPGRVTVTVNTTAIDLYSASSRAVPTTRGSLPHGLYPLVGSDCKFTGASGYPFFCFSSIIIKRVAYSNGGGVCRCVNRFGRIFVVRLPRSRGTRMLSL